MCRCVAVDRRGREVEIRSGVAPLCPTRGCVQVHDSSYVSVYDDVQVHVHVHVHVLWRCDQSCGRTGAEGKQLQAFAPAARPSAIRHGSGRRLPAVTGLSGPERRSGSVAGVGEDIVTTVFSGPSARATSSATSTAAPAEMPTSSPSRRELEAHRLGVVLGDAAHLAEQRAVEDVGDEASADPLDTVGPRRAARQHRAGRRLDGDDRDAGVARPQRLPDAGDRAARADAGHERVGGQAASGRGAPARGGAVIAGLVGFGTAAA